MNFLTNIGIVATRPLRETSRECQKNGKWDGTCELRFRGLMLPAKYLTFYSLESAPNSRRKEVGIPPHRRTTHPKIQLHTLEFKLHEGHAIEYRIQELAFRAPSLSNTRVFRGCRGEYKSPVFDSWDIGTCLKEIFKPRFDVMAFGDCKSEEKQNPIQKNKRIRGNFIGNLRRIEDIGFDG